MQQWIGQKAGEKATELLHHSITLERVQVDWFDHFALYGVHIKDYRDSSLIDVGELWVDFDLLNWDNSYKPTLQLQDIILKDGCVRLASYTPNDTVNINHFVYAIKKLTPPKDTTKKSSPFSIKDIRLVNMKFVWENQPKPYIKEGFDYNHFTFDSIYAFVDDLYAYSDTFRINVQGLQTVETKTHLHVHQLDAIYTFHPYYMELDKLQAHIGNTRINRYLKFNYPNGIVDMKSFNTKTEIIAHLDSSYVDFRDLVHFAPSLQHLPLKLGASGDFNGTVSHFNVRNMTLTHGQNDIIKGKVFIEGLPDVNKMFIDASLNHFEIYSKDLTPYISSNTHDFIHRVNFVKGNLDFTGQLKDFYTYGTIQSGLGTIKTELAMKLPNDYMANSTYEGNIETRNFDLGKLLQSESLGKIQMNGTINGKGFEPEIATIHLKSDIHLLEFNNYPYRNIKTDADIQQSAFNGHVEINDSNMVLMVDGLLDFRQEEKIFNLKAVCKEARLKPLHMDFSGKNALVESNIVLDFKGTNLDDATGNGYITNTYLLYDDNKEINIDTLHLSIANTIENQKKINIDSDVITLAADGDFKLTELASDFTEYVEEYFMLFTHPDEHRENYYHHKTNNTYSSYNLNYDIQIHDINDILQVYAPSVYVSNNSWIKGNFKSGNTKQFKARGAIDTFYVKGYEFQKNRFNLYSSHKSNSDTLLGSFSFYSENQEINNSIYTEKLSIETVLFNKDVDFYTSLAQKNTENYSRISGNMAITDEVWEVQFDNSYLSIKNKLWNISDNAYIRWGKDKTTFDSIGLSNASSFIAVNGVHSNSKLTGTAELQKISIQDFSSLFSKTKFSGEMNGIIKLGTEDVDGTLSIKDLKVDTTYVGDIQGEAIWDNINKKVDVDVDVLRNNINTIELKGYYQPETSKQEERIDLRAEFNDADIAALNPIMKGVVTNIYGYATGNFKITGKILEPLVTGEAFVRKGRFKIPYLGTTYYFDDYIRMEDDYIQLDNIELKDENNHLCKVYGGVYHTYFSNFILNLKGHIEDKGSTGFQALNLPETDTSLFYGEAYVSGNWEILGPSNELKINATAVSKKDTRIFIPLLSTSTVVQSNYITFYEDSLPAQKQPKRKVDLSGIQMDLNFDVTREAYTEIIFDKKAGDIIRGNGEGTMKLTIDTRGEFNMFGNYTIVDGKYNFTLAGLINKEFTIKQGSSITWNGNPYEGILDIDTEYEVYTPLKPIVQDPTLAASPDATRRYPVNVLMGLKGSLLQPEIKLGITIPKKYPGQFTGEVLQFESYIVNNPPELNKQVFSLIVMRKLMPYNSFTGIQGSYSNISELLSNQLSNYLSQVDDNLDIYIDLSSLDRNGLSTFNMRLSYTAMDGRLRISRDGGYQYTNSTTGNNQAAMSIIGEWTVEYMLNPNGSLRVKVYNKVNQNSLITATTSNATMSTGFSIMHTAGFDHLRDLFKKKKNKEKGKKKPVDVTLQRRENDEISPA
ncbi:MAG: translocation/assembly module TamB domain-containing protein [Cytophagaceae bacterium]